MGYLRNSVTVHGLQKIRVQLRPNPFIGGIDSDSNRWNKKTTSDPETAVTVRQKTEIEGGFGLNSGVILIPFILYIHVHFSMKKIGTGK